MTRHHMTSNGPVSFTAEEEAEWDAREAAYVPPVPVAPTKADLLAQLAALSAQIQALE